MFRNLFKAFRRPARDRGPGPANRFRPTVEALEDRTVPTVGIQLTPVSGLSGFNSPLLAANAHDGSNRLFVVEQTGRIWVRQPTGSVSLFLDITARVLDFGEEGLIGLAFHPNFAQNGLFYVQYTRAGFVETNWISEFHVNAATPNVADPSSERMLMSIAQNATNHNGGMLAFGPNDGLLYIGKGDGADVNHVSQSYTSLLGKILRIDVNRDDFPSDPTRNYGIPPDNMFVGYSGAPEIYAMGLRNPFRFSFDSVTGALYVGDVGQSTREEIDLVTPGGNYGWPAYEGAAPQGGSQPLYPDEVNALRGIALEPITDLDRSLAQSIIGGYVYRGTQGTLPLGSYLFGDFITGKVFLYQNGTRTTLLNSTGLNISSFGVDESGELYVVSYGDGKVYKVVSTSTDYQPALTAINNQTIPSTQDQVTVTLSAGDPDGTTPTYRATAQSLALVLDRQLGLRTTGNFFLNWGGRNEKWLLDRTNTNTWYFILPNGELYRWDHSAHATGTLVGTPGVTYYTNIDLLYNADDVYNLDVGRQFRTDNGNLWLNWGGRGEKWVLDQDHNWYFVTPDGTLYLWDRSNNATGLLIAFVGSSFYQNFQLLYNAKLGEALAALSFVGANLTIDRDNGFTASLVVTASASDGELTDNKSFTVTVTA